MIQNNRSNTDKGFADGKQNLFLQTQAKKMQLNPTEGEKHFKYWLDSRNIPYEEQVCFQDDRHKYIFDFLVNKKWVVEIDGGYHNTKYQKAKDKERDALVKSLGLKERRFTNSDIIDFHPNFLNWLNGMAGALKNSK